MSNTHSNKQLKPEKRISWSLILGIFSGIISILSFYSVGWFVILRIFTFPLAILLALIGMISGIIEWKSKEKTLAILGIIICIGVFIFSLWSTTMLWEALKAISS